MGTKVKLRQKAITGNRHALYLDFYPPIEQPETGELTRRQFLKMYVYDKPKNFIDKQHNTETIKLAQQIRQKRENEINKPEIYSAFEKEQLKQHNKGQKDFVTYFKTLTDNRKASNHDNWASAYKYLELYSVGSIKFNSLDVEFCNEFRSFLLKTKSTKRKKQRLSQNSALSYFNKFKAALKQAFKDGYLTTDLNAKIEPIEAAETQRNFLTLDELNKLAKTECMSPILKKAALFSALTGFRFSDIEKLIWGEIEAIKGKGYFIRYRQKKTKGIETFVISEDTYKLLGKRKSDKEKVFDGLKYSAYQNKFLAQWLKDAGISKKITFHCFRHTYATLQLSMGTSIFTVSKMLGHRNLKTTQIYSHILDNAKIEAADKIKLEFT